MDNNESSKLTICVVQIRNLDYDGEVTVKVELGEKLLGESEKVKASPDSFLSVNYSVEHIVNPDDYLSIDEVVSRPLLFSIIESVTSKEKKDDKKDKQNNLAQCTTELHSLVLGETFLRTCLQLKPYPGSHFEDSPNALKAELEISLSCEKPLVNESDLKGGNLLSVTVESLMSLPESWESSGQNYFYVAALPMVQTAEDEIIGVFSGGKYLKPIYDKEVHDTRKRWALLPANATAAGYVGNSTIGTEKYSDESGELRSCEDFEFRKTAYKEKPRIQWNMERKFYLNAVTVEMLKSKIVQSRYWPIEIYRVSGDKIKNKQPEKGEKIDDGLMSFHGVAYVDLTPLVHPGGAKIRGAYKVVGFNEQEMQEKTKRSKGSIAEESRKTIGDPLANLSSTKLAGGGKKEEQKSVLTKSDKKTGSKLNGKNRMTQKEEQVGEENKEQENIEGKQYIDAVTYIMLEFSIHHPFYSRKSMDEISLNVSRMIPQRPMYPKKCNSAEKAISDYQNKVSTVADLLLEEFRAFFEPLEAVSSNIMDELFEERKQKLLYHLNTSGKYLAFKEQLKHVVIKIVRDKFNKTTTFASKDEFQTFLSQLYILLVDEMHVSLSKFLSTEEQSEPVRIDISAEQLKIFAEEADFLEKYEAAEKYYLERISQDKMNPDYWFDAGTHYLLVGDLSKAGECFKECVAVDQRHINGLLMSGICHTYRGCNEAAECLLEAATTYDSSSVTTWVVLGLFYEHIGNTIMSENAFSQANQLACMKNENTSLCPVNQTVSTVSSESNKSLKKERKSATGLKGLRKSVKGEKSREMIDPLPDPEIPMDINDSIFIYAIQFLSAANEIVFKEKALARHLADSKGGLNFSYHLAMSELNLSKKLFQDAEEHINKAIDLNMQHPKVWTVLGHIRYSMADYENAVCSYDRRISYDLDDDDLHYVYLRLGAIHLLNMNFQEAKQIYLTSCRSSATCLTWLGAGIACYRLSQLKEAEEALSEANFLNNENAEVWAYLCLVSMQNCRHFEAKQAYKYATRLGIEYNLIQELDEVQQATGVCLS